MSKPDVDIAKQLNSKTKDELINDITKLINESNNDTESCNSDKIKAALNGFIEKYKPKPAVIKATSKDLNLIMDIFANTDENSKGYTTHGYKIRVLNEEHPFSSDDEVKYFLTNLFGYIENSNLPKDARKEDLSNFFRHYSQSTTYTPIRKPSSTELVEKSSVKTNLGGRRKTKNGKRKYKYKKRSVTKKKRNTKKTIKNINRLTI